MMAFLSKTTLVFVFLASFGETAPHGQKGMNMTGGATVGKAVYFITNEPENAVVALPIGQDGTLSAGTTTKTGGQGSIGVNATGQPVVSDGLFSQSALTVVGNKLFAVNPGSNTLTMMSISHSDPTGLTMVGQPISIPGEFPNTVAASAKNNLVCVGTTGAVAGVSCASFSNQGMGQMDSLRQFNIGQSTPPVGPTNTVSHTFFSDDEKTLFTTVKGNPAVNNTGFLSAFAINQGQCGSSSLATTDMRSSPAGTAVLFGSAPIPGTSSLFVTDASFGAGILSVDSTGNATAQNLQPLDGQAATCWSTISKATGSAFVTDVGVARVVEMSLQNAAVIKNIDLSASGDPGMIDLKAAGNFVYALSPGNATTAAAVMVLDVSGGQGSAKQAQRFCLSGVAKSSAQGMAVLA